MRVYELKTCYSSSLRTFSLSISLLSFPDPQHTLRTPATNACTCPSCKEGLRNGFSSRSVATMLPRRSHEKTGENGPIYERFNKVGDKREISNNLDCGPGRQRLCCEIRWGRFVILVGPRLPRASVRQDRAARQRPRTSHNQVTQM